MSVAPGAIATPINPPVLDHPEERGKVEAEIPLGRWRERTTSPGRWPGRRPSRPAYVVGSTLFVDGGMTLDPNFV